MSDESTTKTEREKLTRQLGNWYAEYGFLSKQLKRMTTVEHKITEIESQIAQLNDQPQDTTSAAQ